MQIVVGDWVARDVAKTQPVKLAALEGLATTEKGAPEHLLGWYDGDEVEYGIEIPKLLSLLAFHDPNATVQGLDTVPVERSAAGQRRPLLVPDDGRRSARASRCWASSSSAAWFRLRRLPATPLVLPRRGRSPARPRSSRCWPAGSRRRSGRQPWVVYRVMRTSEAVTGASGIPVGYATLALVYAGLAVAVAWLLRRLARAPLELPEPSVAPAGGEVAHGPR